MLTPIKTKTITTKVETYKINDIVNATVTKISNKKEPLVQLQYIGSKLKWKKSTAGDIWPMLVTSKFFDLCKVVNPFHGRCDFEGKQYEWPMSNNEFVVQSNKLTLDAIKPELIVFAYDSGHQLFDCYENLISTPFMGDYIGNGRYDSDHYDLEKLLTHFKKHKYVINQDELKIHDVEYYNQNSRGDLRYITPRILLPTKVINRLYNMVAIEKNEFWSCRLKDIALGIGYAPNTPDVLSINQFLKKFND